MHVAFIQLMQCLMPTFVSEVGIQLILGECHVFFSIFHVYKDSQFNNTKVKNSKIQVQNKTSKFKEILYVTQQGLYAWKTHKHKS